MPVAAVAIVETASCPSRIPVATLAADETASCPSPTPVATLAVDELVRRQLPVAALATDETAQAVALPCFPTCWSVAPSFLRDLNNNKKPDLGSSLVSSKLGALVHHMVGGGMPVAAVAMDEAAVCSSTGRSVARGCGLGCSWEWQAAALRLGRRFGHHGCGG